LSVFGQPLVVDVNWADLFSQRGSFILAAEAAGWSFGDLIRRIIEVASLRYAGAPASQPAREAAGHWVVALDRRGRDMSAEAPP
jgi:hypothetical protein